LEWGNKQKILNLDISTNVFVYMVATLAQVLFIPSHFILFLCNVMEVARRRTFGCNKQIIRKRKMYCCSVGTLFYAFPIMLFRNIGAWEGREERSDSTALATQQI